MCASHPLVPYRCRISKNIFIERKMAAVAIQGRVQYTPNMDVTQITQHPHHPHVIQSGEVTQSASATSHMEPVPYPPIMLPPCAICGERSSGYHYGANTCEACKGFFRRCLMRNSKLKRCKYQQQCTISYKKGRGACASCRYQKCLDAGMSVDAIKIGRHTYEKKTKDIKEIKRMELQAMMTKDGTLADEISRQNELDKIIKKITNMQIETQPRSSQDFDKLLFTEQQYLEKRELEMELFGTKKPLSRDDFNAILEATGIEVDDRNQKLQQMHGSMGEKIRNFQHFAESLPGFTDLPHEDQTMLYKKSSFDRTIFLFSGWFNTEHQLISSPNNPEIVFSLEEILAMVDTDNHSFQGIWNIVVKFQNLELSDTESTITAALALMNADCELSVTGRQIVSASTDYLAEALEYLIMKNHEPEERILPKIITLMVEIRTMMGTFDNITKYFYKGLPNSDCLPEGIKDYIHY